MNELFPTVLAKGSVGWCKYCNTLIFCQITVLIKRYSTKEQAVFNQWMSKAWKETCALLSYWRMMQNSWHFPDIQQKTEEENIVKGLSKCANTRHFFFILPKWMVSSRVLHSESHSACRCVFSKTITVPSLFLVLRDTDLFFPRNPLLFFFILLCQKNRVHQQLHEHLQDAMSFLKDVCEVLYRRSLSLLHVPYVSPHFYFLSLVLADVHNAHSELQFI